MLCKIIRDLPLHSRRTSGPGLVALHTQHSLVFELVFEFLQLWYTPLTLGTFVRPVRLVKMETKSKLAFQNSVTKVTGDEFGPVNVGPVDTELLSVREFDTTVLAFMVNWVYHSISSEVGKTGLIIWSLTFAGLFSH